MQISKEAVVVKNVGSSFMLSMLPEWKPFPAVLRGKVRLKQGDSTNPIAVGDRVGFNIDVPDNFEGDISSYISPQNPALITQIFPRRNYLIRKSTNLSKQSHIIASNLDTVYIIVSLYFPELKLPFLDRILVSCGVYGVKATIILNKIDLYKTEAAEYLLHFKQIYTSAGYKIIETSVKTGEGIQELKEDCVGKICLFSGESGVGKSSLIKALDSSLSPKIGQISIAHLQGKHTTSLYEMYALNCGGYIIDTPGIRGFGLVELDKAEIALYFPEMLRVAHNCKFTPCSHTHEPSCAVKQAVEEGKISAERYNSYLGMLEEDSKFRSGY